MWCFFRLRHLAVSCSNSRPDASFCAELFHTDQLPEFKIPSSVDHPTLKFCAIDHGTIPNSHQGEMHAQQKLQISHSCVRHDMLSHNREQIETQIENFEFM